jgi:cell division transport system permease protein
MSLSPRYFVKEALSSFSRGGAMSLVAVLALTLAALAIGGWQLLRLNTRYWLDQAENRLEAVAYFKDGLDEPKVREVAEKLKALPEVQDLSLVSPADAAKELSKDPSLAEALGVLGAENPLPWSARIRAKSADEALLKSLAQKARAFDGVAELDWSQEGVESLLRWMKLLKSGLLILGLALAISAALVTASVIRLTVHVRREEIDIMRMVGASAWFIRMPLLLEGALQGLLGGILGGGLLLLLGRLLTARAMQDLEIELGAFLPFGVDALFFGRLCLFGALLGLAGSTLALAGRRKP